MRSKLRPRCRRAAARCLTTLAALGVSALASAVAAAAPPAASGESASVEDPPVPAPVKGYALPSLVRGGDAFELRMPMAWGLVAYRPRVQIGLGWSHQLGAQLDGGARGPRVHWLTFAARARLDRGRRHVLAPDLHASVDACDGECRGGTVAGAQLAIGYRYMPVFDKKPWLAPVVRGAITGGPWFYPTARTQVARTWTTQLGLEGGAGLRIFLTDRIGVGLDVDLQLDLLLHDDRLDRPQFGLGLGVFPLILEVRR